MNSSQGGRDEVGEHLKERRYEDLTLNMIRLSTIELYLQVCDLTCICEALQCK